jgi:hypothetical protein
MVMILLIFLRTSWTWIMVVNRRKRSSRNRRKKRIVSSHILIKVKFVYKFDLQNLEGQLALPAPVSECHNPPLKGAPSSSEVNLHPYREKE